jgi:hypothetical protein
VRDGDESATAHGGIGAGFRSAAAAQTETAARAFRLAQFNAMQCSAMQCSLRRRRIGKANSCALDYNMLLAASKVPLQQTTWRGSAVANSTHDSDCGWPRQV